MSRLITPARWAVRLLAMLWLAVGLLLLLPGCGGGDELPDAIATKPATPDCTQPGICT